MLIKQLYHGSYYLENVLIDIWYCFSNCNCYILKTDRSSCSETIKFFCGNSHIYSFSLWTNYSTIFL